MGAHGCTHICIYLQNTTIHYTLIYYNRVNRYIRNEEIRILLYGSNRWDSWDVNQRLFQVVSVCFFHFLSVWVESGKEICHPKSLVEDD